MNDVNKEKDKSNELKIIEEQNRDLIKEVDIPVKVVKLNKTIITKISDEQILKRIQDENYRKTVKIEEKIQNLQNQLKKMGNFNYIINSSAKKNVKIVRPSNSTIGKNNNLTAWRIDDNSKSKFPKFNNNSNSKSIAASSIKNLMNLNKNDTVFATQIK